MFVPNFRPVHPVTGKGWEGVGVFPDIETTSSQALAVAHREALGELLKSSADAARRAELVEEIERVDQEIGESKVDASTLAEFTGKFDIRMITVDDTGLFIQRDGGPRLRLVVTGQADVFSVEMAPDGRVRFVRDDADHVVAVEARLPGRADWERSWRDGANAH